MYSTLYFNCVVTEFPLDDFMLELHAGLSPFGFCGLLLEC